MEKSALQIARAAYQPKLPKALRGALKAVEGAPTQSVADQEEVKKLFPNTYGMPYLKFEPTDGAMQTTQMNVGVILSGGQAPGGHNVISGLFDGIKKLNPANKLYGFILGPGGLVDHKYKELTADIIDEYRNTGGFDIIGSGRTKLEKKDQFDKGLEILKELNIWLSSSLAVMTLTPMHVFWLSIIWLPTQAFRLSAVLRLLTVT